MFLTLLFFLIVLIILREFMYLSLKVGQSKNTWKLYKKKCIFINRWFFWSTYKNVKDKFSKNENRIIRYTSIARIYRVFNIFIHILLILQIMISIIFYFGNINNNVLEISYIIYGFSALFIFVFLSIIEFYINKNYHIKRYRKRG